MSIHGMVEVPIFSLLQIGFMVFLKDLEGPLLHLFVYQVVHLPRPGGRPQLVLNIRVEAGGRGGADNGWAVSLVHQRVRDLTKTVIFNFSEIFLNG